MSEIDERAFPDKEATKAKVRDEKPKEEEKKEDTPLTSRAEDKPKEETKKEERREDTVPLATLMDEREQRKSLQKELDEAKEALEQSSAPSTTESTYYDDTTTDSKVKALEDQLNQMKVDKEYDAVYAKYPVLKDKLDEFKKFKQDYPQVGLMKIATLYVTEKGLLGKEPVVGLESPTQGGTDTTSTPGKYSEDELKEIRENNPRKYIKLAQEGKIGN